MATTQSSRGVKIYIGPAADDTVDTVAEFDALSFTEIKKVKDIGNLVDRSAEVAEDFLDTGRTEIYKGIKRAENLNLVCANNPDDPGQAAVIAAEGAQDNYAFKIEQNDDGGANPTTHYFRAQVLSQGLAGFSPNSILMFQAELAVNSERYTKAAA